jgi:hypothetical protein
MHEHLMEAVVEEDNRRRALEAVKRNRGAVGIDHMTTSELGAHLQAHWEKIRAKSQKATCAATLGVCLRYFFPAS